MFDPDRSRRFQETELKGVRMEGRAGLPAVVGSVVEDIVVEVADDVHH